MPGLLAKDLVAISFGVRRSTSMWRGLAGSALSLDVFAVFEKSSLSSMVMLVADV
jgi:hypothetical protein